MGNIWTFLFFFQDAGLFVSNRLTFLWFPSSRWVQRTHAFASGPRGGHGKGQENCSRDHQLQTPSLARLCSGKHITWSPLNPEGFNDVFITMSLWCLQHCAVASPHPKRKQVTELLLRKGANIHEKNKEWVFKCCTIHLKQFSLRNC